MWKLLNKLDSGETQFVVVIYGEIDQLSPYALAVRELRVALNCQLKKKITGLRRRLEVSLKISQNFLRRLFMYVKPLNVKGDS